MKRQQDTLHNVRVISHNFMYNIFIKTLRMMCFSREGKTFKNDGSFDKLIITFDSSNANQFQQNELIFLFQL